MVAGIAAMHHDTFLSNARAGNLSKRAVVAEEVFQSLGGGMRTLRKDLASNVQPDAVQQGLSTVSSVPTAAGGIPGAPLPALAIITGHHPQVSATIQPDTSGNAAAAVLQAQKLSAQHHRSGNKRPNPSSFLGSHNACLLYTSPSPRDRG